MFILLLGLFTVPLAPVAGQAVIAQQSNDSASIFLTTSLRHGLDTTVSPCVDFDRFVNGGWQETYTFPDSVKSISVFSDIYNRTQRLFATLLDSARTVAATTQDADVRVLGYYYESCMRADSLPRQMQRLSMHAALPQDTSRRMRCTRIVMHSLSDAMSQVFIRTILPSAAEQVARQMIDAIRKEVFTRVKQLSYVSPEAKQRIVGWLEYMTLKIMKPKATLDHTGLTLSPTDLSGNQRAVDEFIWQARMHQKDTVPQAAWSNRQYNPNAHYNPANNSVEIPALLFQWPFFDANGDLAIGYAAAGVVIGHEIFHGVTHRLQVEDQNAFDEQVKVLVQHYSSLSGVHVDGLHTLSENLADLGGVLVGYDAWARTVRSSATPLIEGFTPDQRFFMHYARLWRKKERTPGAHSADTHSPAKARINGVVMNVPAFAKAFGCKEGDPMAKPERERAAIW